MNKLIVIEGTDCSRKQTQSELLRDNLTKLDYKEAKVSEPLIGSIAHSVVAIKVNDGVDIEKTKKEIKEKVNPAKWVCVNAENVIVLSKGDVIVLIMTDENDNGAAKKMQENFNKVK